MYHNAQLTEKAKATSAIGFITKDITAPVLKEIIINATKGIPCFLAPVAQTLPEINTYSHDPFLLQYKLSPREMDIIQLIKEGNATKQIAALLELSVYTVETHRKNINRKLNVQSTAELIAIIHKANG